MLEMVFQKAHKFDVVHIHTDYLHFPPVKPLPLTTLTTLHGRLDIPDLIPLFRQFSDVRGVSVSAAQRKPVHWANWRATAYHGLPAELYRVRPKPGSYLEFLGATSLEKRVSRALQIAT